MPTLALETSDRPGSIALFEGDAPLEVVTLPDASRRHGQDLVVAIDELLRRHERTPRDLDAVAVGIGPGSFTGLRIGVVCAKTLAYATGCRLAAVDTLACIAENGPPDVRDVWVVSDAQRGDLYAGRYRRDGDRPFVRQGEVVLVNATRWFDERTTGDVVSGPGLTKLPAELTARVRTLPEELRRPSAAQVGRIGRRRLAEGDAASPWSLVPFYLRKSAAEEKRLAGGGG